MSSDDCCLKYPLLMVHGMGFRDRKHLCYWGRIPKALEQHGAVVRYGLQDCWASVETNARTITTRIDEILREPYDFQKVKPCIESKVFGIGV